MGSVLASLALQACWVRINMFPSHSALLTLLLVALANRGLWMPAVYLLLSMWSGWTVNLGSRFSFLFVESRQQYHLFFPGLPSNFHLLPRSLLLFHMLPSVSWVLDIAIRSTVLWAGLGTRATLCSCRTPPQQFGLRHIMRHPYFLCLYRITWLELHHFISPLLLVSCYLKWSGTFYDIWT